MSDVHNLNDYKASKAIVAEIDQIRPLLKSAFKDLSRYKKYIPIKTILNEILGAEVIFKNFHSKHKKILEEKGKL